jgi:hypothetical protein
MPEKVGVTETLEACKREYVAEYSVTKLFHIRVGSYKYFSRRFLCDNVTDQTGCRPRCRTPPPPKRPQVVGEGAGG